LTAGRAAVTLCRSGDRGIVVVSTSVYLIVFRVLHIVASIAWGGAVFLFVVYVQPAAAAIAPAGAPLIRELLVRRRMLDGILALAMTSIVAGGFLYWHDWQLAGSFGDWVESTYGAWLTFGAVAAIAAVLIGLFVSRPTMRRMLAIGAQVAEGGGTPTPEQARELAATQNRLKRAARTSLALIVVAAVAMSTARYW
jgi:hypothetical protein